MNTLAVVLGLLYGLVAAGASYVVSMVASGLFARSFYRIYARVLIGVCSAMLLVPLLRWVSPHPFAARMLLTATHYVTLAILGYGVVRFNREFMKTVFLEKRLTAYFTFGTLANAALVAMIFLHVAAAFRTDDAGAGHSLVGPEHYGPFVMLLAAMIFHTDYYLKQATGDFRRFSKFTFLGYGVSFVAVAISTLPYFGGAFESLGLSRSFSGVELALLENFSCGQTLLLAIVVYGALVWYLESIPPVYLLLLALCGEYHVLVTQWAIQSLGAASWGLASLPLFMGMTALAHYFMRWDQKRSERQARIEGAPADEAEAEPRPRFVVPFQVVACGLAAALVGLTLWTRFAPDVEAPSWLSPAAWLSVTFVAYAVYCFAAGVVEKNHLLMYAGAAVATLAALFGWEVPGGRLATVSVAALSAAFAAVAWAGGRVALKREYRTAFADVALATAAIAVLIVLSRHVWGVEGVGPYRFHSVDLWDGGALLLTLVSFVVCARQYGSRLPVYGVVVSVVVAAPTLCAASSFLACIVAEIIRRRVAPERAALEDERLSLLGRIPLPLQDRLPSLYSYPLAVGALPLSLLGLAISVVHVMQGDLSSTAPLRDTISTLAGAAIAAVVLGLLTRTTRSDWLLALAILASYFAVHATAQRVFFSEWTSRADIVAGHLIVSATLSLLGWAVATGHSGWCVFWLKRIAEEKEAAIRERHVFYSGMLHHVSVVAATTTLGLMLVVSLSPGGVGIPKLLTATAGILTLFFGLSGAVYRSKLGSYLSLASIALSTISLSRVIHLPEGTEGAVLAALGLALAAFSAALWKTHEEADVDATTRRGVFPSPWDRPPLPLAATGLHLWLRPLAEFSLMFGGLGVTHAIWFHAEGLRSGAAAPPALVATLGAMTLILLLGTRAYRVAGLYIVGIATGYATLHVAVPALLDQSPFQTELTSLHVLLAAAISLVGWCVASAYAAWCNRRLRHVAEQEEPANRQRRAFYSGNLHHVTLFAAALAAVALILLTATEYLDEARATGERVAAGPTLALFFALSAATYRSRLQSYLSLLAVGLTCYGCVGMLAVSRGRSALDGAVLAVVALILGAISWWFTRFPKSSQADAPDFDAGPIPTAWPQPPLPGVSRGVALWEEPLAQVSVLLGFSAVAHAVFGWGYATPVWTLGAFYVTALVWLLGTATNWLGMLHVSFDMVEQSDQPATAKRDEPADRRARECLYVLSIGTFYFAIHATAHVLSWESLSIVAAIPWHALLAAGISLVGWAIAVGHTARCNALLARASDEQAGKVRDRRGLYAGLLQHVVLVVAISDLVILFGWALQARFQGAPPVFVAASLALSVLFGLSGAVYATRLGSYLALISRGLSTVNLAGEFVRWLGPELGPAHAAMLASLAVAMTVLASFLWRPAVEPAEAGTKKSILPSPWDRPPLPLTGQSLRELWAHPLAEVALLFGGSALAVVAVRWGNGQETATLATFYLCAVLGILAARLYQTPILTYLAVGSLWASVYPLVVLLIEDGPYVHSGTAVAVLSLAAWGASFLVERRVRSLSPGESSASLTGWPAQLVTVFERPLGRCAGILAVIAVGHSLLFWRLEGWTASHRPLFAACAVGAVSLLLSAWTMKVTQRLSRARLFVYLACVAVAGGCAAGAGHLAGFDALGPALAVLSLLLAVAGLVLLESLAAAKARGEQPGGLREMYGEPLTHSALVLPVFAVILGFVNSLPHVSQNFARLVSPELLADASLSPLAAALLVASLVYLISVRAMREAYWLYPAVILGSLGILVLVQSTLHLRSGYFVLTTVALMHVLVGIARGIQQGSRRFESLLGVADGCTQPFCRWPALVTGGIVLGQGLFFGLVLSRLATPREPNWPWLVTPLLTCGLFLHLYYLERRHYYLHVLIASSVLGCLGAAASSEWLLAPDLAVATLGLLWGIVAVGLASPRGDGVLEAIGPRMEPNERASAGEATAGWAVGLLAFSLAVTVPTWMQIEPGFPSTGLTLLLVAIGFAVGGFQWRRTELATLAAVLLPAGICAILAFLRAPTDPREILPIACLVIVALSPVYVAASRRLTREATEDGADAFVAATGRSLSVLSLAFTMLAAVGTLLSVLLLPPSVPVALTLGCIAACWFFMTWSFKQEALFYLAEVALFCTFYYVRHEIFDHHSQRELIKSFGVIGLSFLMYGSNIVFARGQAWGSGVFVRPTYYSAIVLPLALLKVTPLDDKGVLSLAIFAAATFYMLVAGVGHLRWPVYVTAVLINVALYLWIPTISAQTGLLQLYVIPAALTVLIFTQLHRGDLNRPAVTGIRIAASAAILAVSTFEVFTNDSLLYFVVVLALSLVLAVVGVALRVRPFVYIGVAFLVINVLAQLGMQVHSQGGIARAIILIAVGFVVMGIMIFFNIKREALLRRYRSFVSDASWE